MKGTLFLIIDQWDDYRKTLYLLDHQQLINAGRKAYKSDDLWRIYCDVVHKRFG
jgi:hypothetical protein